MKKTTRKTLRYGSIAAAITVLVVCAVVILNVIVSMLASRYEWMYVDMAQQSEERRKKKVAFLHSVKGIKMVLLQKRCDSRSKYRHSSTNCKTFVKFSLRCKPFLLRFRDIQRLQSAKKWLILDAGQHFLAATLIRQVLRRRCRRRHRPAPGRRF